MALKRALVASLFALAASVATADDVTLFYSPAATDNLGGLQGVEVDGRDYWASTYGTSRHITGRLYWTPRVGLARHTWFERQRWGIGIMPTSVSLRLGGWGAHLTTGVWQFNDQVPVEGSRNLVFTAAFGLSRVVGGVVVGVHVFHLSNAGRGEVNPGLNHLALSFGKAWQ